MNNFTLKQLKQVKYMKKEINVLQARINELKSSPPIVSDTVSASLKDFPYTKTTVEISGIDRKLQKLIRRLQEREDKLTTEIEVIETYLNSIEDSCIRQIIELKFIQCHSWNYTAKIVFGYPCGDKARKKVERFFIKNL